MFNSHFLTIKLNLMNKMNLNLFQKSGMIIKAFAFGVIFMAGLGTASAQYQGHNDALITLKGEIQTLIDAEQTATGSALSEVLFRKNYFMQVFTSIDSDGKSVDDAIHNDLPTSKPNPNTTFVAGIADGDFKDDLAELVTYAENLLAE